MAIKQFKDYDTTKSYSDYQALPTGGYVLKIMDAKIKENRYGQYVQIRCDIAEGEYAGFFKTDYENQDREDKKWHCNYLLNVPTDDGSDRDKWTKRRFRTFTEALEDSNQGYHFDWDESKFQNKLIGGLFNIREYVKPDGNIGSVTNLAQVCSCNKVRSGNYKLPKDKLLDDKPDTSASSDADFMTIPEGQSEIPWD